jgi:hypothetical protein
VTDAPDEVTRRAASLHGIERLWESVARLLAALGPVRATTGWATIELDRAERELTGGPTGRAVRSRRDAPADALLGARCRIVSVADAREIVLLEPSTEGLLAAALARHGEGSLALYLSVGEGSAAGARRAGVALSRLAVGPLGQERRVLVGPRDGPFILLVDPALPRVRSAR